MDEQMEFEHEAHEETDAVDTSSITAEELAKHLGEDGDAETEGEPEDNPAGEKEVKKEDSAALKAELEELRKRVEETEGKATHWRQVSSRHAQELGPLRELKAKLLERAAQLQQAQEDPHKLLINDPRGFQNLPLEQYQIQQQVQHIEAQEREIGMRAYIAEQESVIRQHAPEIFQPEMQKEIAQTLRDYGDKEEDIAAFLRSPGLAGAGATRSIVALTKARLEIANLKAELEKAKSKPSELTQRIEKLSKTRPVGQSAGGSTKTGSRSAPDIPDEAIISLTDKELAELLKDKK